MTIPASAPTTTSAVSLDGRRILADVEQLASPALEGRRTGSPGNHAAQTFIVERLRTGQAAPLFTGDFRQPFAFTHHSMRGLLSPSGRYTTDYPDAATSAR